MLRCRNGESLLGERLRDVSDFGTLKVDQVIMHRVPRGGRRTEEPETIEFSEAPIELSTLDRGFIELRLKSTLAGRARPVVEDPSLSSPTPATVKGLLSGTGDLVSDSVALTRSLHELQKWVSPVGLVMVITGQLDGEPCLIITKMEHEEGMRVQRTSTADGKLTYKAEYLRDLILGEGTQVFKVGIFKESDAHADALLRGLVVDAQQSGSGVAAYFIEFLGCQFVRRSDVLTETFFKEGQRFIARTAKDDPERHADYQIALLSEMQSSSKSLSAETFAQLHLRQEDQDAFVAHLSDCGLPVKSFRKDVTLVASSIRRFKLQTERGATVLAPPEMYSDGSLTVESSDEQLSTLTITDHITHMSGASGPKAL